MQYLKCSQVDSVTGIAVSESTPATNGPALPFVAGIEYVFALESQYPTLTPVLYCTAPDEADSGVSGVLELLSQADFDAANSAELAARDALQQQQIIDAIADRRYLAEVAGFAWGGYFIDTERDSQAKINSAFNAARDGFRVNGSVWKCLDLATNKIVSRPTSNDEMIDIGQKSFQYVQACYDREGELLEAAAAGTFSREALEDGWPSQQ